MHGHRGLLKEVISSHMAEKKKTEVTVVDLCFMNAGPLPYSSAICECRSGFFVVLLLRLTSLPLPCPALCLLLHFFFSLLSAILELLSVHTFPNSPRSLRCFVRVLDELSSRPSSTFLQIDHFGSIAALLSNPQPAEV